MGSHGTRRTRITPRALGPGAIEVAPALRAAPIDSYLVEIGWSQRELARRLGRSQTMVRLWRSGARVCPDEVLAWLQRIVEALAQVGPIMLDYRVPGRVRRRTVPKVSPRAARYSRSAGKAPG